jgi:hypothetical protein
VCIDSVVKASVQGIAKAVYVSHALQNCTCAVSLVVTRQRATDPAVLTSAFQLCLHVQKAATERVSREPQYKQRAYIVKQSQISSLLLVISWLAVLLISLLTPE